ncbi:MAG: DUF885 domain-containing protein [Gammaproteobacteria bacterium]|nr:DUF885 domain-containing protein [Gammaproteobacteria bacterium]
MKIGLYRMALLALLSTFALAACNPQESSTATAVAVNEETQVESWDEFINRQIEEHVQAHPFWAVGQGRHEFDGQMPDWSRDGILAENARQNKARQDALAFSDEQLTAQQQYQRDYFVSRLDHDLFWNEKARWPFRNPQFYLGWMSDSLDPSPYIALDYAPKAERMRAFIDYQKELPRVARQIRENLEMPMPRTWLQLGIDAFGGYATYFAGDAVAAWADVEDPDLQAEFEASNAAAIAAMTELQAWLESNRDTATEDYALGDDLYLDMLWDTERVRITLDELWAVGWADLRRNQASLAAVCETFAPGEDIRDCFARMADNKPADGVVIAARDHLEETRAFVEQENLVSIPGTEKALVDEAPPYARSNFAYINIPGPWEKDQPSVYYIAPPNPEWPEDIQQGYIPGEADLMGTSIHEVWPGHFLNFLHANRAEFFYGRVFVGYAFAEGWAHYTEEMMMEAGFRGGDPEMKIGQISNALLRNARFIASMGMHTRGWSVDEAKEFFMVEGFQDEGNSIQQAARGTYDPAYLNYTMGKLMIMKLREDWTATRGGRDAWKAFHDEFLSYGGPPVPLVRQQMMGESEPRAVFPDFVTGTAE